MKIKKQINATSEILTKMKTWKETNKYNQSLRQKHYPSGQSFSTNQSKSVKSTTAEYNSKSKPFHLPLSAVTLNYCRMTLAAAQKQSCTSCQ